MVWKKIKTGIEFWEEPCLGTVKPIQGKRFMALCVDPSSKKGNYLGLARQVIDREGSEDIAGFTDTSKLVIVGSKDLLNWKVVGDLKIEEIEDVIEKFQKDETKFIGLEDPDIVVDEKNLKHIYFTIAYKYLTKEKYEIYLGNALGKSLDKLKAASPVLFPIGPNTEGFKELAASKMTKNKDYLHLVEMVRESTEGYLSIATIRATGWNKNWTYEKIALHPWEAEYSWCKGHVSPCRILPREMIEVGNKLRVLLINGREPTIERRGKKFYGKFCPGLALYNPSTGEIPWVAPEPLFEDPDATTITFASEVVPFDDKHCLIYAHVNDSFVRAYKVEYSTMKSNLSRD